MFLVFNKQQYIKRVDKSKNKYRSLVQTSSLTNFFLFLGFPPYVNTLAAAGLEGEFPLVAVGFLGKNYVTIVQTFVDLLAVHRAKMQPEVSVVQGVEDNVLQADLEFYVWSGIEHRLVLDLYIILFAN